MPKIKVLVVISAITLLAFALRIHRLEDKSIWWDEGASAWLAPQDLATITFYQARDQHPPLFYWTLHLWNALTGNTAFTLRFLSVISGTLCVPLAYVLGKSLAQRRVGLLAALFVAVSRFHICWSQEIKMYAMVSFLSIASTFLVVLILRQAGWLRSPARRRRQAPAASSHVRSGASSHDVAAASPTTNLLLWIAYVIVTTLALYAHYLALPIVFSQNLFVAIMIAFRTRNRSQLVREVLLPWSLSQLAIAALFALWFSLHQQHSASWSPSPAVDFFSFLRLVATLLSLGTSIHLERYTWLVLALWLPPLLGIVPLLRQKEQRWGGLLMWLCLAVPPILIYLLSLPRQGLLYEAKIAPRFFLISLVPYSIVLAWSLVLVEENLPRHRFTWGGLLGVALVLASSAFSLRDYYALRYLHDDYQTLARAIQAGARPNEAILLDTDREWPVFEYHYSGSLPRHHIPAGEEMTPEKAHNHLKPVWDQYDGLWVVFTSDTLVRDPEHTIENWLEQHGQVIFDQRFDSRRLMLYVKSPRPLTVVGWDGFAIQYPLVVQADENISLVGYDQALREVRTGDALFLVTYWHIKSVQRGRSRETVEEDFPPSAGSPPPVASPSPSGLQVEAMLINEEGIPVSRAAHSWEDGDAVSTSKMELMPCPLPSGNEDAAPLTTQRIQHDLDISAAVPSGEYDVCLAIAVSPVSEAASTSKSETEICPSTVRVVRTAVSPPVEPETIQHPASTSLGDAVLEVDTASTSKAVRFLGYDLAMETYRPGEAVELTLYWQALRELDIGYVVFVHLLGSEVNPTTGNFIWGQVDRVPVSGAYPTTAWATGETIADSYHVPIQSNAPPGIYQIEIGLYEPITEQRLVVLDETGQRVEDRILLQEIEIVQ